jgi:hypothetical protein
MKSKLIAEFDKINVDIKGFALLEINLPRGYERAIENTQVTK